MDLDVEADVEMYFTQTVSNNKIYFHIGNVYSATNADKTAYVSGSFASNNGQDIGISFLGQNKDESNFQKDSGGAYTGVILNGMHSANDTWREQDNNMDLQILLNYGNGWEAPVNYGDGAHDTVTDTLWWLVNAGEPGSTATSGRSSCCRQPTRPTATTIRTRPSSRPRSCKSVALRVCAAVPRTRGAPLLPAARPGGIRSNGR